MLDIKTITAYFLSRESMNMSKLQKLCYYSQVWSLKLYDQPLFINPIEAWLMGPCIEAVYKMYAESGRASLPMVAEPEIEDKKALELLKSVYTWYGHYSSEELIWLSQHEFPWMNARAGLDKWEGSKRKIKPEAMVRTRLEDRDRVLASYREGPISFGFKLWDFNLKNNEDALNRGDWFQEILESMGQITGKTKDELERQGILALRDHRKNLLESIGFSLNNKYKNQYDIRELTLRDRSCSLFGVFIDSVFHIVWFVSKKFRGPIVNIDERVNMALKEERTRKDSQKLFELEKENKDLEKRNRELWDLLDEMTDPKIKKYKQ